ncbi:MAG: cellulose biosynthesis cyclic di-GMP-binding regulatory protein BcsB [Methylobacterium frigidaeris]
MRLAGENAALEWPVYFSEAQARERQRFRVAYLSAISVAPEASTLTATVNDTQVGQTEIKAPGAVKVVEFDLPEGLLRPGWNAVRLSAVQRHRVDCSLRATYELWTQLDPSWTGFVAAAGAPGVVALRDLPALRPDATGAVPIRIVIAGKPSPAQIERQIRAAQALALAARITQPVIEFGPALTGDAGVNLAVGAPEEVRALPGFAGTPLPLGGRVAVVPASDARTVSVVATGASDAEFEQGLAEFRGVRSGDLVGTRQGLDLLAREDGYRVTGSQSVRLDALGLSNREFNGRLFRTGFDIALPADFVPADYGKAILHLAGGYAPGLAQGAQVIVDLNGRNAASLTLPKAGGELFADAQIPLPLSLWDPGRNHVEIAALVPSPRDATCDTLAAGDEPKRFLFLNSSRLEIPALARAVRIPDLAATASGAVAYVRGEQRPRLVVPGLDRESMSAAATLAVRLAVAAGRTIPFEISGERTVSGPGATLVVAPVRSLDPSWLQATGVNPDQIRQVWQSRAELPADAPRPGFDGATAMSLERLRNDVPASCSLPPTPGRTALVGAEGARGASRNASQIQDLVSSWDEGVLRERNSVFSGAGGMLNSFVASVRGTAASSWSWLSAQVVPPPVSISPRSTLLVSQSAASNSLDSVVTLVTAPTAAMLRASVACLVDPGIWTRLDGRLATLDATNGVLSTVAAEHPRLAETQPPSLANIRLVVAGWLSLNPFIYVALSLAVALLLGVTTRRMVRGIGRHNDEYRRGRAQ